jgi:transforming growth factor-beta-induced protein
MKLLSKIMILAILSFGVVSCSDDDNTDTTADIPNLVEAAQDFNLTVLLDAIGAVPGLDQTLLSANSITVFAPTNNAFTDALTAFGVSDLNGLVEEIGGVEQLETVLGFHVVPAAAFSFDLSQGEQTFTTLSGQDITVTRNGNSVSITDANGNVSNVIQANIEITNGVVHTIDAVLLPELTPVNTFSIIEASPDHTVLEQLLVDAGFDEVLAGGEFTVFAPTDAAFGNIDTTGLTQDQVANILLNHVVTGNVLSTDLVNGYVKTNATETYSGDGNNVDMYINIDGSNPVINGNSTVTVADLESLNGTVHVVNEVITIPNVVDLAAANPMFSTLATALTEANLLATLSTDAGTSPAPFTVFAPNNDAFGNFLAEDNGFDTAQDILDSPLLSDVLTYHVLPNGGVRAADITDGVMPATVQGATLTINTTGGVTITDQDGRTVNIIATDVTGSNGVIHVLDNVILPVDL